MDYEVTIGIPLYNAERFIRETLCSALDQTFGNIEFLVLDDCGTDRSADIVRDIQTNHPRGTDIRIVRQPHNMGVGPARNRIIDEARGKYLYFLDSDDKLSHSAISVLYDNIRTHDAEIVFGSYEKIYTYDTSCAPEVFGYERQCLTGEDRLAEFAFRKYGGIQASACNYLVSLDFLRRTGVRFIESRYWEDMVFTYSLVTYVTRAVLLPDITYYYMCREDSLSNYQRRKRINKDEVTGNARTIDWLKGQTSRIVGKPYIGNWCYNVVMTDFYIVCGAIRNRDIISPALTSSELRSFMRHPLTLDAIMRLRRARAKNLFLYLLGKLPSCISVWCIRMSGKRKGLI